MTTQEELLKKEKDFLKVFELNKSNINDSIYLELICILNENTCENFYSDNIIDLKYEILELCIKNEVMFHFDADGEEYNCYDVYDAIKERIG